MFVRSKVNPDATHYAVAGTKPFKSELNTVVNHLMYVASASGLSVYDPDGNRLASLDFDTPQAPV